MKILHVIPNAFDYFEDIHSEAFEILEAESLLGVEVDAVTIGYGGVTKKEIVEVKNDSPSREYVGQEPIEKNIESWEYYDVINIHCPFFGELGTFLQWFKDHPEKFLIITLRKIRRRSQWHCQTSKKR